MRGLFPCLLLALAVDAHAQGAIPARPGNQVIYLQPQPAPRPAQALLPPPTAPGIESPRRTNVVHSDVRIVSTNARAGSARTNQLARATAERERLNRNALQLQIDRAAEGSPVAMRSLAQRYMTGDLVPRDEEKAREWLKKAAALGDAGAQVLLDRLNRIATNNPAFRPSTNTLSSTNLPRSESPK